MALTMAMGAVVVGLHALLGDISAAPRLAALVSAGAVVYLLGAVVFDRIWLRGMWALFRRPAERVAAA